MKKMKKGMEAKKEETIKERRGKREAGRVSYLKQQEEQGQEW